MATGESANRVLAELAQSKPDAQLETLRNVVWTVGCPVTEVIELLREREGFQSRMRNQVQVAVSTAKLTSRILLGSPWVTLVFCQWLGLNPLGFLLLNQVGWVVVAAAACLSWIARAKTRAAIKAAETFDADPGFNNQLAALAIACGYTKTESLLGVSSLPTNQLRQTASEMRSDAELKVQISLAKLPQRLMLHSTLLLLPATMLLVLVPTLLGAVAIYRP